MISMLNYQALLSTTHRRTKNLIYDHKLKLSGPTWDKQISTPENLKLFRSKTKITLKDKNGANLLQIRI